MKTIVASVALLLITILPPPGKKITLWMIGDSTMSVKETIAYPETGWGMPFVYFWDSTVTVDNRAKNGRSTRTFIEENRWKPVTEQLKPGDYVFVQFGHNDEVPTKGSYTTETAFAANLSRYVAETREKGATPVLLTPVARRKFDSTGHIVGTHDTYSAIVRTVAAQTHTTLIDLDRLSQDLLQSWGDAPSALLFNHLKPGEHPNYPEGKDDNTHFNELGARIMAELVLKEIRRQVPDLASHIRTIVPKK
ncbi:MAG: rhamnogalacturonan acetylesterase [Bacteroidota bacterium]|nr:rhamnogalacturonan acetylesterase [Bacteroidota bacterium]